jgi:selenide,water dikinase
VTRLVLLGGGHAHALVLLEFRKFISKNLDVVLVNAGPVHTYSGMVPGVIAGHYAAADAQIDLAQLARNGGARLVQAKAVRIDTGEKRVHLDNGDALAYDVLSLNLGSSPEHHATAIPVKPFEEFMARWRQLLESGPAAPRIAVVGAGAGGVEIAMAMQHALGKKGSVSIFSEKFGFSGELGKRIRRALEERSIPLHLQAPSGAFDVTFGIIGPAAPAVLRDSGLRLDAQDYVLVDAALRSLSHPDVFAAGDCASLEGAELPKSGVYAVKQGAVLAQNLKRVVRGMTMLDYTPQVSSLSLISCGTKYAIASRGGWSAEGRWAWWWKNWIDRRWIARFR